MNLVFAIKTLNSKGGGAERVLMSVASGLADRGHAVTVATCQARDAPSFYRFDDRIHTDYLAVGASDTKTSIGDFAARTRALRAMLRRIRPDAAIGFMNSIYVPLGLASVGTGIPVVASEHIGPEYYATRTLERTLLNLTPLVTRRMTVVSDQIRTAYRPWLRRKMTSVANPVDFHVGAAADVVAEGKSPKILLSVGRLEPQKDQLTLIDAFARVAPTYPEWTLRIVGEGSLRSTLERRVRELGIADRVELPGFTSNVDEEYARAQLFALPSLYESFGLVVAEALLHQLPAVAFADCAGTNRLIRDGVNGLLVAGNDRVASLARAIGSLMADPASRLRLATAENRWIIDTYGLKNVLDQWEALLSAVVNKP